MKSVTQRTADKLGLEYCDVNQLQFDGLLCAKGCKSPFSPILSALEHENVHPGFDTEIWKLMSVRCPLKVGITYSINERNGKRHLLLEQLRERVMRHFEAVNHVVGEDPSTEYAFLLGCEDSILFADLEDLGFLTASRSARNRVSLKSAGQGSRCNQNIRKGWLASHADIRRPSHISESFTAHITVVSGKLGDDVRPGTYRAILRQTGIKDQTQ